MAKSKLLSLTWHDRFADFTKQMRIDSKESGVSKLVPYRAQELFTHEVFKGLENNVHSFVCLKARQLGISTISLALDLFWLFVHPGLQGALVTDSEDNKEVFRNTIDRYLEGLPSAYKVKVNKHNRVALVLDNGSVLQYLVAGTKGKSHLGTSRALNFLHATEVAKWGAGAGLNSLVATLAERHPDRLYIFESTANGFNHFRQMWTSAKEDVNTTRAFFIGWWAKELYRIERNDPRWQEFMADPPTDEEREKAQIVEQNYNVIVQPEQLCWYRWRSTKQAGDEGTMEQEYPWHEEEAFVVTGNHFFPSKRLAEDLRRVLDGRSVLFKAYRYVLGDQFTATELDNLSIEQVKRSAEAHLRIWEPPLRGAKYVTGVDPAFGRNDWKDRHAISVWRCYADRLVQVAEYATPDPETYQIIWVLAHLAAQYRDCVINVEVNGPGAAVLQGLKHIKAQLRTQAAVKGEPVSPKNFLDALGNARWYLYHRPDSMGAGYAYGWKTQADNKLTIMNQMRDSYMLGHMTIKSGPMLEEMQTIVQDGAEIAAAGKGKDDRVFAACFAHKAWIEWVRAGLQMAGRTYEKVTALEMAAKESGTLEGDPFIGGIIRATVHRAQVERIATQRAAAFKQRFSVR